ncbi:MAG: magnesium transporter CorA family protein [bacterium]
MIKTLNIEDGNFKEYSEIDKLIPKDTWIHISHPTIEELNDINKKTNIDYDLLLTTLDDQEVSHVDYSGDTTLIVLDIPYIDDGNYCTIPLTILFNNDYYVTACTQDTNFIDKVLKRSIIEPNKHIRLTIQILTKMANEYIISLRRIDDYTKKTEKKLIETMKNKEIISLKNIHKSLVHFSTSLNSNKLLINKLIRIEEFNKYEEDKELMEDMIIEHDQAVEMCGIYRDIITGSMESFSNIIGNNMNNTMQTLAIVTLVMSFPTLVASIFGMNVPVPFSDNEASFYWLIIISLILSCVSGIVIFKVINRRKRTK